VLIETTLSGGIVVTATPLLQAAQQMLRGSFPVFAGDEKCVNFLTVRLPVDGK